MVEVLSRLRLTSYFACSEKQKNADSKFGGSVVCPRHVAAILVIFEFEKNADLKIGRSFPNKLAEFAGSTFEIVFDFSQNIHSGDSVFHHF